MGRTRGCECDRWSEALHADGLVDCIVVSLGLPVCPQCLQPPHRHHHYIIIIIINTRPATQAAPVGRQHAIENTDRQRVNRERVRETRRVLGSEAWDRGAQGRTQNSDLSAMMSASTAPPKKTCIECMASMCACASANHDGCSLQSRWLLSNKRSHTPIKMVAL